MSEIKTVKIKIWGIVQGVGFRPFVAKLAHRYDIKGEVLNMGGIVEIIMTDTVERIDIFIDALKREKPFPAEIVHIKIEQVKPREFNSFTILDSDEGDDETIMIPADLSICPDCLAELKDESNPRYLHPFISCMVCGPRYTIIDKIPYDRENTSMVDFTMCEFCKEEYTNLQDRRYHAQTISCHDCGPMLLYKRTEVDHNSAASIGIIGLQTSEKIKKKALEPIAWAMFLLLRGGVIALKGVGGYHFLCSPFKEEAVKSLRVIKQREEKPFALMFRDIEQIKDYCYVTKEEEKLLLSNAKPIVLLERKPIENQPICEEVYMTSRFIGAFLPSMGVQYMLINLCGPLIMTSANLADRPIMKDDEEIFEMGNLSGIFYNDRKIKIRLDDSVVRVIDGQPQMIRRSKGYAPVPLNINNGLTKKDMILATGGQLKSAFSLSKGSFAYISQYFGDLESNETCNVYTANVDRMKELLRIDPKLIVCDLHPLYFTTKYAEGYAEKHSIKLLKVQHHHAHVASVMAEHDLQDSVIGVSFDGTGYGTDGAIWGGEFLVCKEVEFDRVAHLEYVKMLGGDSSMKDGWKSAMSYVYAYQIADRKQYGNMEERKDSYKILNDTRWPLVKAGLDKNINTIQSSSMGRLFDAIAAFTGIHDRNRYEGECAITLENAAYEALSKRLMPYEMKFKIIEADSMIISAKPIFQGIEKAQKDGISREQIALGFHNAVAEMILDVCKRLRTKMNTNQVALTGGVFQNKILMEQTIKRLRKTDFNVYYNISVGPNDGGICLGQNYLGMKFYEGE